MPELWTCDVGTVDYRTAVDLQERLRARVIAGDLPDLLLLLEHPPVYTIGRRSDAGRPIGWADVPTDRREAESGKCRLPAVEAQRAPGYGRVRRIC